MSWQVVWSDATITEVLKDGFSSFEDAWAWAQADFATSLDRLSEALPGDKVERDEHTGNLRFSSGGLTVFHEWVEETT